MTPVIAIHGGAGTIRRARSRPERAALERSLQASHRILKDGGSSLEAVTAAVVILEDSGLFNAGRGAAPNADEEIELDAGIMDGATLRAGGVAAARRIKNPIVAAREVMEHGKHVLLAGAGAERFARRRGLKIISTSYFRKNKASDHGTVGAVALDRAGNLAAATSTGGIVGKLPGRVGDSPIVGAGVYADNATCAVSGTGEGELFIRSVLAFNVAARMRYLGESLARAGAAALAQVARLGGCGGLVAVDRRGRIAMPFNSEGMHRACIDRRGRCMIVTNDEHVSA
jgi:isoaspartyl peptidase/L-asparaginase-like protein (Ntn-hydrolase superfamily)